MVLGLGESLKVVRAGMSLLRTIRSKRRESVLMILCVVWRTENVRVLDIVASHESRCLNVQARMEDNDVLNRNWQRSRSPRNPLTWWYSIVALNFIKMLLFRGTIRRVEYMVSGIPHVPHSVPKLSNERGHPSFSCRFFSTEF